MHQELVQRAVAAFVDAEQALLPAGGMLARHEPQPGGKLTAPKGESNKEHKADLHTGGVLSTRPGKPICYELSLTGYPFSSMIQKLLFY
jgi:hypothetical protein